ncbi:unnamed protein product [Notodromas monacha]|uniref:U1-type domain-containing protein n=1 Tax=Notodromas monacha TaxID=399045 RepID=A0A7R9GDY8_9CRUS|nr:unnamed protein product [Notodromas monacha]CAG0919044.1 unnamed protein product [Notodromas monacha]
MDYDRRRSSGGRGRGRPFQSQSRYNSWGNSWNSGHNNYYNSNKNNNNNSSSYNQSPHYGFYGPRDNLPERVAPPMPVERTIPPEDDRELTEAEAQRAYQISNSLSAVMSSLSERASGHTTDRRRRHHDGWRPPLSSVIDKGAFPTPKKRLRFMDNLYCTICNIDLTSESVMEAHIKGMRHLKKSMNLRQIDPVRAQELENAGFSGVTDRPAFGGKRRALGKPGALAKLLEDSEHPIIGAEFLEEYSANPDSKIEPVYYCTLCSAHSSFEVMFQHVIGQKHRMKYLVIMMLFLVLGMGLVVINSVEVELKLGVPVSKCMVKSEAAKMEREMGRQLGKIKTISGLTAMPDFTKLKAEKNESSLKISMKPDSGSSFVRVKKEPTDPNSDDDDVVEIIDAPKCDPPVVDIGQDTVSSTEVEKQEAEVCDSAEARTTEPEDENSVGTSEEVQSSPKAKQENVVHGVPEASTSVFQDPENEKPCGKSGLGQSPYADVIGSLIGCTIKSMSDLHLAVNVCGSLMVNLLCWHQEDEVSDDEAEAKRQKPEVIPVVNSILDNIKRYTDLLELDEVLDLVKNRKLWPEPQITAESLVEKLLERVGDCESSGIWSHPDAEEDVLRSLEKLTERLRLSINTRRHHHQQEHRHVVEPSSHSSPPPPPPTPVGVWKSEPAPSSPDCSDAFGPLTTSASLPPADVAAVAAASAHHFPYIPSPLDLNVAFSPVSPDEPTGVVFDDAFMSCLGSPSASPPVGVGLYGMASSSAAATAAVSSGGLLGNNSISDITKADVDYSMADCWGQRNHLLAHMDMGVRDASSFLQSSYGSFGGSLPPLQPFEPPISQLAPASMTSQPVARPEITPDDPEELFNVARMKGKRKLLPSKKKKTIPTVVVLMMFLRPDCEIGMIFYAMVVRARDGLVLCDSTDVKEAVDKDIRDGKRCMKLLARKLRQFDDRCLLQVGKHSVW